MIHTRGHTDGSIALHLPQAGVLFTADVVAHVAGQVMPGVFNLDQAETLRSVRRLAEIDASLACVGHGEPVPDAHTALAAMAAALPHR